MGYSIAEANVPVVTKLRYKGVFDYGTLGKMILKWLYDHKYKVTEGKHKHKMSCPHGFEIERTFLGVRNVNDFIQYKVNVALHFWDAREVDAVKDGKKVKLWQGRIEIKMGMSVVCDYQGKWNTPLKSKMLKFLCEYVIKKELIVKHADHLYYKLLKFNNAMTKFLGMETRESVF